MFMRQMTIQLVPGAALALPLTAQASSEEAVDQSKLWNDRKPIYLGIKTLSEDATGIGLDKETHSTSARRHLDEALLYEGEVTLKSSESFFPPPSVL